MVMFILCCSLQVLSELVLLCNSNCLLLISLWQCQKINQLLVSRLLMVFMMLLIMLWVLVQLVGMCFRIILFIVLYDIGISVLFFYSCVLVFLCMVCCYLQVRWLMCNIDIGVMVENCCVNWVFEYMLMVVSGLWLLGVLSLCIFMLILLMCWGVWCRWNVIWCSMSWFDVFWLCQMVILVVVLCRLVSDVSVLCILVVKLILLLGVMCCQKLECVMVMLLMLISGLMVRLLCSMIMELGWLVCVSVCLSVVLVILLLMIWMYCMVVIVVRVLVQCFCFVYFYQYFFVWCYVFI